MEHNVKYGRIWLEIFGIGIKWKMGRGELAVDISISPRPGEAIHLIKVIMN